MLNDNKAVALIDEALEHSKQTGNVIKVQTGRGFIEDEQGAGLAPFGQMTG